MRRGGNNRPEPRRGEVLLQSLERSFGKYPGAIAADSVGVAAHISLPKIGQDQLNAPACAAKYDGLDLLIQQFTCQVGSFEQGALPNAHLSVEKGGDYRSGNGVHRGVIHPGQSRSRVSQSISLLILEDWRLWPRSG